MGFIVGNPQIVITEDNTHVANTCEGRSINQTIRQTRFGGKQIWKMETEIWFRNAQLQRLHSEASVEIDKLITAKQRTAEHFRVINQYKDRDRDNIKSKTNA